ncbi:MAG: hypothetical protein ACLFT1_02760, partial [Desulfonatronovibrio sp.]
FRHEQLMATQVGAGLSLEFFENSKNPSLDSNYLPTSPFRLPVLARDELRQNDKLRRCRTLCRDICQIPDNRPLAGNKL